MKEIRLSFDLRIALKQTDVHWVEEELLRLREQVFLEFSGGVLREIEEEALKGVSGCGRCGCLLVRNGHEPKRIKTLIGTVQVDRVRLRCQSCGEDIYPLDEAMGLADGEGMTLGVRERALWAAVEEYLGQGIPIVKTLAALGIPRSSYYRWIKKCAVKEEKRSSLCREVELRPEEVGAIVGTKQREPWLSHRQISGRLREQGIWVSESSCYRVLKAEGWVEERKFRERPWEEARYEPYRPNQIWGLDWTGLRIEGLRWYLLTVIDFFSRYLLAWAIVKTVTQTEVTALVALAVLDQKLDDLPADGKPWLRMDRGSPNTTSVTKEVIRELGMILSYGRVDRPTDNARQERFYRTIKQEEIYTVLDYPSYPSARASIGDYITTYYNQRRPNQALWNFTPAEVHRARNKTELKKYLHEMRKKAKLERKNYWTQWNQSFSNKHLLSENLS